MDAKQLLPDQVAELEDESDPLLRATLEFEEAAADLDLEDWIVQRLRHAERELTANLPLVRDNGEPVAISGVRVQHFSGGLPTLGSVRLSPEAHLHAVRAAAMEQTWQLALLQLPFGGAAGAIVCNPEELSERELRSLARAYAHALRGFIGHGSDVPTLGAGCHPQTVAWMLEATRATPADLASVAGKPEALFGLPHAEDALAYGICGLLGHIRPPVHVRRISLQGWGKAVTGMAQVMQQAGVRVVAAADSSGGLQNPNGIDASTLAAHWDHRGMLFGYADAEAVCNADVLEAECDALVLAAAPHQITSANASHIRAAIVFEASLGAISRAGEEALLRRGVIVVPWGVTTAGATLAAYLEWLRNTQGALEQLPDLPQVTSARTCALYDAVHAAAQAHQVSLRRAAHVMAVERVAAQMRLLGSE